MGRYIDIECFCKWEDIGVRLGRMLGLGRDSPSSVKFFRHDCPIILKKFNSVSLSFERAV